MKDKVCYALVDENGDILADTRVKTQADCAALIQQNGRKYKVVQVKIGENKRRSMDQNALFHVWCQTLSGHVGEPVNATKQGLKIKFGFPILLAGQESGPILRSILNALGWSCLSWETKVSRCEKYIPVTSIMDPKELKQMMDNIKNWAMSEHNVHLDNGKG